VADQVQRWDWMTGLEVPLDAPAADGEPENELTNGGQMHFSSPEGFVGLSQGGRVSAGTTKDQLLLTAKGTG